MNWTILIASSSASFLVYLAGIYSHSKVVKVSLKDKDMSWQLDVIYSCVRVFVNTLAYFLYAVTYMIPNLYLFTGEWFCYASKMVLHYNNVIIAYYTLTVAILKYVVIVHWQWARVFGHDKIKKIFSIILGFCIPLSNTLLYFAVRPDFLWAYDGHKQVDMCLGDPKGNWEEGTNRTQTKLHVLCLNIEPATDDTFNNILSNSRKGLCWFQVILGYLAMWNLLDCAVYIKIFSVMKRQISGTAYTLNDETNTNNMKKLKVNAQVTTINTLVEMTGSITYIIILAIMKGNTFSSFIYQQFFYNVILPFSFLSNTSDNKTRIVDVGWKNVIKNIIDNMRNQIVAHIKIVYQKISVANKGTNNRVSTKTMSENDCRQEIESKNDIFTTRVVQNEITSKTINELNVPIDDAEQSSSKSLSSEYNEKCVAQNPKCSTYEQLDANKLLSNDNNQTIKKKMIANMAKNVSFEEKYLELFKAFVAFHEGYITKEYLVSNGAQNYQPSLQSKQHSLVKNRKGKGKKSCSRIKSPTVHPEPENSCTELHKSTNAKDKIVLRLNLLNDTQFLNNGNDGLDEMIERIITLEESFLERNQTT